MDEDQTTGKPSAHDAPPRAISARRTAQRPWRRRAILSLPQLSLAVVLLGLLLGARMQFSSSSGTGSAPDQVYTVQQVLTGLQQDSAAWTGHTLLVHGVVQGPFVFCGQANPCPPATLGLVDDGNGIIGSMQYLPVAEDPAIVGHLPYNVPATFKVRLQAAPAGCAQNPTILCYEAVVQGANASS